MNSLNDEKQVKRKGFLLRIVIAALAALAVTAGLGAGAVRRLDQWAQDSLFQRGGAPDTNIVIIGIDDLALDLFGPYNTWDRTIMASALEKLAEDPEKKPAVTAVDILYAGNSTEAADARLAAAAEKLGDVITASMAEFGEEITWDGNHAAALKTAQVSYYEPYPALRDCTVQGHINAMYDTDGVMRHGLLRVEGPGGEAIYSLAYETAKAALAAQGKEITPPAAGPTGLFYIPYTAKAGGYSDGISIAQVIAGKIPADYWAGKIVLIGPYAAALQDAYYTPIDRAEQTYGVEIQANIIQSLLQGRRVREVPEAAQRIAVFLISFASMMLFLRMKVTRGAALAAGLAAAGAGVTAILYRAGILTHPLWIPGSVAVLYILSLGIHYAEGARERQALRLEKERIETELSMAARIQESALIRDFPVFPDRKEFTLHASMLPAREVGGDLYDFFLTDEDHLVMVIGDVSGKGYPAALFMMVTLALLRHIARSEPSPAAALRKLNEEICARNPEEMFVTVWMGVLEISTGKMRCANAGHEYPALRKPGESYELLKDKHGFVIGGMEGIRYREYEVALEPGSGLFVYTDGVPEATDGNQEMFGPERMMEVLRRHEDEAPEEVTAAMNRAVLEFTGNAPQFDDVTMLCLQYRGSEVNGEIKPETASATETEAEAAAKA